MTDSDPDVDDADAGDANTVRVGVDEAGKGPVLGPMVVAAVRAAPEALPDDVDDSKSLSASRRESMARTLRARDAVAVGVAVVPVDAVDDAATDMNSLTVRGQAAAVGAVAVDGDRVVADAGDTSEARFGRRVREAVADGDDEFLAAGDEAIAVAGNGDHGDNVADESGGIDIAIDAEHGADETDAVVGAASVVAKVERDRRVAALGERYDRAVGSGYPSDPTTREFLRWYVAETGDLPDCARSSWATARDVLDAAAQSGLDEF